MASNQLKGSAAIAAEVSRCVTWIASSRFGKLDAQESKDSRSGLKDGDAPSVQLRLR